MKKLALVLIQEMTRSLISGCDIRCPGPLLLLPFLFYLNLINVVQVLNHLAKLRSDCVHLLLMLILNHFSFQLFLFDLSKVVRHSVLWLWLRSGLLIILGGIMGIHADGANRPVSV
jgi:hypothetical protein